MPWRSPFAYSSDLANLLTGQLTKFTTLNRHQLAGHLANLDFWLAEARHALDVLDGYRARFDRLKQAESEYIAAHQTREFHTDDPHYGHRDISRSVALPRRTSDADRSQSRRQLCDAVYRFLVRSFREQLLDETRFRRACESLEIGIDSRDLTLR